MNKMKNFNKQKGFTLIELLVVIAIIGMISSITLSALGKARNKGKDAAIKQQMNQLAIIANLNFNDYGDYCNVQRGWIAISYTCTTAFLGNYASQASSACTPIYNNATDVTGMGSAGQYRLYAGTSPGSSGTFDCYNSFSFMAPLSTGKWYCIGSRGKGEYASYDNQSGCYNNP